jgi:hypothetical protein
VGPDPIGCGAVAAAVGRLHARQATVSPASPVRGSSGPAIWA